MMERLIIFFSILLLSPSCLSSPARIKRNTVSAALAPFSFPLFGINPLHLNILPNDIAPNEAILLSVDLKVPKELAFLIPGQFPDK